MRRGVPSCCSRRRTECGGAKAGGTGGRDASTRAEAAGCCARHTILWRFRSACPTLSDLSSHVDTRTNEVGYGTRIIPILQDDCVLYESYSTQSSTLSYSMIESTNASWHGKRKFTALRRFNVLVELAPRECSRPQSGTSALCLMAALCAPMIIVYKPSMASPP